MPEMTAREERMACALMAVMTQYFHRRGDLYDSNALSAAEATILALAELGLMEVVDQGRIFGRLTEAGERLMASG